MDVFQRISRQFFDLYRSMSPSQRVTLTVVPLLVVAGFGWMLWQQRESGLTALSYGKVFSTEEIIAAEQALIEGGLTDFRREGQRLMVPVADVARYNAALPRLKEFILPAGTRSAAVAHVCRTVARRAERAVVALTAAEAVRAEPRHYLNRLSDLLFVLARVLNRANLDGLGGDDVYWRSDKLARDEAGD